MLDSMTLSLIAVNVSQTYSDVSKTVSQEATEALPALVLLNGADSDARLRARELGVLVECHPVDVELLSPFVCRALAFAFAGDSEMAAKISSLGAAAALGVSDYKAFVDLLRGMK